MWKEEKKKGESSSKSYVGGYVIHLNLAFERVSSSATTAKGAGIYIINSTYTCISILVHHMYWKTIVNKIHDMLQIAHCNHISECSFTRVCHCPLSTGGKESTASCICDMIWVGLFPSNRGK